MYATKAGAAAGGSGRRRQAVGLSLKIWSAVAPIWRARRAVFNRPMATPRWIPTRGAPVGQVRRRRGCRSATVLAMAPADEPQPERDLLSVALFVFFVSLILIVAGMLFLPVLLR